MLISYKMEFDAINVKRSSDCETILYENTKTTAAPLENTASSKPEQTENDEGHYEKLSIERNMPLKEEDTLKRIKLLMYIILALGSVLCITVIALIIVVAVPKDGGWSLWENWGSCTESCGGGIRTRSRSCINPTPSLTGRPCVGGDTDVSTCNRTTCPEHIVAFTAYNIHNNSSNSTTILFQNTYTNFGNAYNATTGEFVCNVSGVYHFVVTLTTVYQDTGSTFAYLSINGSFKLTMFFDPDDDDSNKVGAYMLTGAGTYHLNRNDVVYVYVVPNCFYYGYYSYFTGFLITPDQ